MKTKINSWPPGTPDFVNHRVLYEYIRDTSKKTGVDKKTIYDTRVEKIEKSGTKWYLKTSTLPPGTLQKVERLWVGTGLTTSSYVLTD